MRSLLLLVLSLCFADIITAQNNGIRITGACEYSLNLDQKTGQIKVGSITNDRKGGTSGTLMLQMWLLNAPYSGTSASGRMLYEVRLGELNGGYLFTEMNYPFSWDSDISPRTYYISFVLLEYFDGGFQPVDYVNFDKPFIKARETTGELLKRLNTLLNKSDSFVYQYTPANLDIQIRDQNVTSGKFTVKLKDRKSQIVWTTEYEDVDLTYHKIEIVRNSAGSDIDGLVINLGYECNTKIYKDGKLVPSFSKPSKVVEVYIRRSDIEEVKRLIYKLSESYD